MPPSLHALRAVLFDLDGTLVRTAIDFGAMREAMRTLARERGVAEATEGESDVLVLAQRLGEAAGEEARREALAHLEAIERAGCVSPEPIEGATALLKALAGRGIKVGVVTRNCRSVALELLMARALSHDTLVAREDCPRFKPHPEPLWLACQRLGIPAAASAMVGDYWPDVAAGRAAGVRATIGIQWPHDPPGRFAGHPPDWQVDSLRAAARLLL